MNKKEKIERLRKISIMGAKLINEVAKTNNIEEIDMAYAASRYILWVFEAYKIPVEQAETLITGILRDYKTFIESINAE